MKPGSHIPAEIERVIELMARMPGLGPRSARRAALYMARRPQKLLSPLALALTEMAETISTCPKCRNLAAGGLCPICSDPGRSSEEIAVVADIADLWALERSGLFRGRYHVLGGLLSALDRIGPEELGIPMLLEHVREEGASELILALPATVDGRITAHYIAEALEKTIRITSLAQGVPVGGELDYLDEGTIGAALNARRPISD